MCVFTVEVELHICDHACINQPLGAKVEFAERRKIANAFTILHIHFSIPYNAYNFGSIKKLKRSVESA